MYARDNHHHSFHTPLVGEKQLLNSDLNQSPLHQNYKYSDADVFSKKRKNLCHLIAETSSREVKQLSLKGLDLLLLLFSCSATFSCILNRLKIFLRQDLVTALLSRLFPQGNENNLRRTEKPKVTKSSIHPESLTYYTSKEIGWEDCQSDPMMGKDDLSKEIGWEDCQSDPMMGKDDLSKEIGWEDCQSDPMMGKDDLWLSVDNSPLECDSRRSREKYLPKWGTTSILQPRSRNGDIFKFNHHCDAMIPGVSDFDRSHYSFDVDNYNLEGEYQQHKQSRDITGWDAAVDYQPPLTRLWERFCNESKITRYDYFDHRLTSSIEKYSRPYTGTYEWFGDFGSTTYFKQPTEVLDRRVLTVGRESSLPLLGWDYENSTTESEQMSFFPQLPASSTGGCNIPPDWSVNDELHHQTFVYRYPLTFNTPLLPYYHSMEDLQPQYPGRRDYLICGEEEDEISDFVNVATDDQSSSPGIFSSMVVLC
ncbi:uncharacterized protein LOC124912467 [Impatiens glandulifera]|uniref:uncharacterized protein LOC124912467 n=1 Tax=Impatiens glandulifera TaxID=253017 RepID=UPI001FB0778A|nr:uncharacterized protein LOC124912467 [Impatiens glandulifera]